MTEELPGGGVAEPAIPVRYEPRAMRFRLPRPGPGFVIASALGSGLVALAVSIVSLVVAINSYRLAQRPYVGFSEPAQPGIGNPDGYLGWKFFATNTGALPARVTVSQRAFLIRQGVREEIPLRAAAASGLALLAPGQRLEIEGAAVACPEIRVISELGNGQAELEVDHVLTYGSTARGWLEWARTYTYRTRHRFDWTGRTGFILEDGEAD